MFPADFDILFDALSFPAFVVSTAGFIERANRAATVLVGRDLAGESAMELDRDHPEQLRTFLRRASGSRQATIGILHLRGGDGTVHRLRCHGRLLRPATEADPATKLLIDCLGGEERFSALADRIRELNEEIRKRRHMQAVLEESLRQRDVLMRELHHRVRNNLQMLSGMLAAARAEARSPEAQTALQEAGARVAAIGAIQQVLHTLERSDAVSGADLVRELCASFESGILAGSQVTLSLEPVLLSNEIATPLALILNELITNAVKHGRSGGAEQSIRIELKQADGEIVLAVEDQGPGFDLAQSRKKASGLGLVLGLLRQIGGRLEVQNRNGARCEIRVRQHHPSTSE